MVGGREGGATIGEEKGVTIARGGCRGVGEEGCEQTPRNHCHKCVQSFPSTAHFAHTII